MKINIYGHETILTNDIRDYTEKKIGKLSKYYQDIIGIDLTLEENHHMKNKKAAFLAKGIVKIPGYDIKAEAIDKTLFAAVDDLESKLGAQLRKGREKLTNKSRFAKSKRILRRFINR